MIKNNFKKNSHTNQHKRSNFRFKNNSSSQQNNQRSSFKTRSNNNLSLDQYSNLSNEQIWIIGKNPVLMALTKARRKFYKIIVGKNFSSQFQEFLIKNNLQKYQSLVRVVDNSELDQIVQLNQNHQGIAVLASRLSVTNQLTFLTELNQIEDDNYPNLLVLDQISDPQNVGAIIRSAVAFGFNKIIFCKHNSLIENSLVIKASAGNIELVDLIVASNINNFLEKIKKLNYWCFGLDSHSSMPLTKVKEFKRIALVVGSEGEGIRQLIKKNCDYLLKVETNEQVESLNVAVATAIALYEINNR